MREWIVTIVISAVILMTLRYGSATLIHGHWLHMPVLLLWIYALLALRAAALSAIRKPSSV